MITWNTDFPEESGYYLATWKHAGDGRSLRVSEFWFDGRNWWTGRSYITVEKYTSVYEQLECVTDLVIAWTAKPKPFRRENAIRR